MIVLAQQECSRSGDVGTFMEITVVPGKDTTEFIMDYLEGPDMFYDEDGNECYEPGEAKCTINIRGTKLPPNDELSRAFHTFIRSNQIKWTSALEQDILWEVVRVTEV